MRGIQCKHVDDQVFVFADLTPYLQYTTATISSVAVTCDDNTVTLGTPSVLSVSTNVPWLNEEGQVVQGTIAANKGAKVLVSGGTAQSPTAEPARIAFAFTLSTGEIVNRSGLLRVEE
jgi:hypothetical protein